MHVRAQDLALSNGASITTWTDISGAGNSLTQATANNKPQYYSTSYDSKPAVIYPDYPNSTARWLANAGYSFNKQAQSVLAVVTLRSLPRSSYIAHAGASSIVMMETGGILRVFSGSNNNTTLHPQSGRRIAVLFTFGAGAIKVYLDSSANVQSFSASSSGTLTGIQFGDNSGVFIGGYYEIAAWNKELSGAEAAQLLDVWAPAAYGTGLSAGSPAGREIYDGDSITEGIGDTIAGGWPTLLNVTPTWATYNYAVSGSTWADLITRQAATNTFADPANYLIVNAGTNNLAAGDSVATIQSGFQTYMLAAVAAGFDKANIAATTLNTTNQGAGGTVRDAYNTWLRTNYSTYAGHLIDLAADPQLGVVGGTHNNPALWIDGAHNNDAGYSAYAALVRSTIPGLPYLLKRDVLPEAANDNTPMFLDIAA